MLRETYLAIMHRIDQHVKSKMLKVNSIFQQFDSSGDGCLSKAEFRKGVGALLSKAAFTVSPQEINGVFATIDHDGSNEMSYKEFAKELKDSDPARQASLAKKLAHDKKQGVPLHVQQKLDREAKKQELAQTKALAHQLTTLDSDVDPLSAVSEKARKFLQQNMQKAINLFRQMDTSGDNLIDQQELQVGLKTLGLILTETEFNGLWGGLDADGSGACDLLELEQALRGTDPVRKAALEKYSRPPLLKPRNDLSKAAKNRDRR